MLVVQGGGVRVEQLLVLVIAIRVLKEMLLIGHLCSFARLARLFKYVLGEKICKK